MEFLTNFWNNQPTTVMGIGVAIFVFLTNFWNNQPTTVIGIGVAIFVFLGIYISLLQTYQ